MNLFPSMRKSLQRAIPGAMSLPDVMMLDTGRGGEQLPLPDIAKAQSFAGRVSRGVDHALDDSDHYQGDSHTDCPYCRQAVYPIIPINFVSDSDCSECVRDREMAAARSQLNRSVPTTRKFAAVPSAGGGLADKLQDTHGIDAHKSFSVAEDQQEGEMSQPDNDGIASASEAISRHVSRCHKHADEASGSSFKSEDKRGSNEPSSLTSKSSSLKRDMKSVKNLSNSSSSRSSDGPHPQSHRKLAGQASRNSSSLRSSSAGSSVKTKLPLQQSNSLDVPAKNSRSTSPVDFYLRRPKSQAGSAAFDNPTKVKVENDEDNDKSDSEGDHTGLLPSTLRTETTTDDYGFSSMPSMPTETVLVSEQNTKTVEKKSGKDSPGLKQKSFLGMFGGGGRSGSEKNTGVVTGLPPRAARKSNKTPAASSATPCKAHSLELEDTRNKNLHHKEGTEIRPDPSPSEGPTSERAVMRSPSLPSSEASQSDTRKESDATSGIGSDESPGMSDRRGERARPPLQQESLSDVRPVTKSYDK